MTARPHRAEVTAGRRTLVVLVAASTFGGLAAWVKGQGGDGVSTASQVRAVVGNLSTPWLLLGLLAGGTCARVRSGALLGLAATLAALTGFYALTGAVLDLDGQRFPTSALGWMSANRLYYAAGVVSGCEPLVLIVLGLLFPHGASRAPAGPAPVHLLLWLLGSWTLTSSEPPAHLSV